MDVRLAQHPGSDTTVVSLHGQLDIDTSSVLGDVLTQLHRQAVHRIVVDLADVSFCDSTGLSALLVAFHRARATGGYLRLAGPSPFLLRLLTVTGVHGTVPVFRSAAAACRGNNADIVTEDIDPGSGLE